MTRKPIYLPERTEPVPPWDNGSGLQFLSTLAEWKGTGDFNLDNIKRVLSSLGDPQDKVKSFHVTGTNGKGSVSAGIASILGATGARVGMTISPHLARINERIVIDGMSISDEALDYYSIRLKDCCDCLKIRLSFFEGITAISFLAFADLQLDWVVAEVGLGGRLDATNTISKAEVSVITSIDRDHEHILGDSLAKIALEKAGIIKGRGRVVAGQLHPEAAHVVRDVATQRSASLFELGKDFELISFPDSQGDGNGGYRFSWQAEEPFSFRPSLKGAHQGRNMALAIAAASLCGVDRAALQTGVSQVFWPGRLERFTCNGTDFIVDSAHNPAGIKSLVDYLKDEEIQGVTIGFGVLETKHWQEMVDLLVPFVENWNLMTPHAPCALNSGMLADYLSGIGITARDYGRDYSLFLDEVNGASDRLTSPGSRTVLICGSMYLIGIIREKLIPEARPVWRRTLKEGRGA